jgi:WD40 repeat protein
MTNDISETNVEEAVPCIALSKNDSYLISASGGKVSLFNMMTFKVMTTFMPPPPAATFLAFYPQDNNIIAIGLEDSTIQIYNVRVDDVNTVTFLLSSSWCKRFGYVDHTRAVEGFLS